jgi:hypothetical protein
VQQIFIYLAFATTCLLQEVFCDDAREVWRSGVVFELFVSLSPSLLYGVGRGIVVRYSSHINNSVLRRIFENDKLNSSLRGLL